MAERLTLGGVEGGGTKFDCIVGAGPDDIADSTRIVTTTGEETLAAVADFFADKDVDALGVATFGPLDLDQSSLGFGHVIESPKPGWSGVDVAGSLHAALGVPVAIDTDVNGAALGEARWGAGSGFDPLVYVTVGTGIGGGGVVNGAPMHGRMHPEMGHIRVPRHPDDEFVGNCGWHGDCLEGLAAGPAIAERWGKPAEDLGDDREAAVLLESHYLGVAMASYTLILSPERIILGGGVLGIPGLLEATRGVMVESLGGYLASVPLDDRATDYLVAPGLGNRSGVLGGLVLAESTAGSPR